MKNPQSKAVELQSEIKLETIGRYGCCAFVLLWCLGIEPDDLGAIETVNDMIKAGVIGSDCTVKWADAVR